jgi:hypothetical protein
VNWFGTSRRRHDLLGTVHIIIIYNTAYRSFGTIFLALAVFGHGQDQLGAGRVRASPTAGEGPAQATGRHSSRQQDGPGSQSVREHAR